MKRLLISGRTIQRQPLPIIRRSNGCKQSRLQSVHGNSRYKSCAIGTPIFRIAPSPLKTGRIDGRLCPVYCGRKAIPPEAAIDAIDFAAEIKNAATDIPTDMIARLRAAAIRHRPQGYMMIATQMEMIAYRLDYERKI